MRPHPAYCDHFQDGDDLSVCAEREEHASRTVEAHVGDEIIAIYAKLVRLDLSDGGPFTFISLTLREDGGEQGYPLPLGQARLLANALRRLLDLEKREAQR